MNSTKDARAQADLFGVAGHTWTNDSPIMAARSKADVYTDAERRMRRGKQLVISGFIVAIAGVIAYCVACFSAGVNQELGSALLENPEWLVMPTLGVIGLGTLLWLVGSFLYLTGGMDSDPEGPDIHF